MTMTPIDHADLSSTKYALSVPQDRMYPVLISQEGLTEQDSGMFVSRASIVYQRFMTKIGEVFFPIADIHQDKHITKDEVQIPKELRGHLEGLIFHLA